MSCIVEYKIMQLVTSSGQVSCVRSRSLMCVILLFCKVILYSLFTAMVLNVSILCRFCLFVVTVVRHVCCCSIGKRQRKARVVSFCFSSV